MGNNTERNQPKQPAGERRRSDRSRDDTDWESKVLARVGSRVRELEQGAELGWEAEVVDKLRRRIRRDAK